MYTDVCGSRSGELHGRTIGRVRRLLNTIDQLGGIATRRQLLARGFTGPQLTAAVRAGVIRRVRQGHYALLDADVERLAAVRLGGRLGCLSAMKSLGLWAGREECVHVTLPANAARLRTNVPLRHRDVALTPDRFRLPVVLHWRDVPLGRRVAGSAWRVDLVTALADVASCASRRDVRAAFESAIHAGRIELSDAQRLLDAVLPPREVPMVLSAASGSGAESYFIEELVTQGLTFRQQVSFSGVGYVDFLVAGRLVVEVDGYEFHSSKEQFELDRERDAVLLGRGYPTLRIPARVVLEHPDVAAEMLRNAVRALDERSAA